MIPLKPPFSFLILNLICVQAQAQALDCSKKAGSLPNQFATVGTANTKNPIEHIVVIIQENRSFDSYLGKLNQAEFYPKGLDGWQSKAQNPDSSGKLFSPYHETNLCIEDTEHNWPAMHQSWNLGLNDGFVKTNGPKTMAYYDQTDLPYYYALANSFATSDRYFSSAIGPTYPNRFFLYAATAFGHTDNDEPKDSGYSTPTIFDLLTQHKVSWKYYVDWQYLGGRGYLALFRTLRLAKENIGSIADYHRDAAEGKLPSVVFLESFSDDQDEHPNSNIQAGQAWAEDSIRTLMNSPQWKQSVLFLTYDEAGGFYDHVSPPAACRPDAIEPLNEADKSLGGYDHLGFRVPFFVVSPYVKHHYISHVTHDHTSILRFIETKFNLPALTARDANASDLSDFFQYDKPDFSLPALPSGAVDPARDCKKK